MQEARKIDIGRQVCKTYTAQFGGDQSWPSTDEGESISMSPGVKRLGLSGSIPKASTNTIYNVDLDGGHLPDAVRAVKG
jgi:hypothetical protein